MNAEMNVMMNTLNAVLIALVNLTATQVAHAGYIDPSYESRIANACDRGLLNQSPEDLANFGFPSTLQAYCECVAARHMRKARQDVAKGTENEYLRIIEQLWITGESPRGRALQKKYPGHVSDDWDVTTICKSK